MAEVCKIVKTMVGAPVIESKVVVIEFKATVIEFKTIINVVIGFTTLLCNVFLAWSTFFKGVFYDKRG